MNYTLTLLTTSPAITATVTFPADFLAFQGHFPDQPLLPGFMHIQLALDTLKAVHLPHQLKEVSTAKFSAPILPDHTVTIILRPTTANTYDAKITSESDTHSTFTLTIQ